MIPRVHDFQLGLYPSLVCLEWGVWVANTFYYSPEQKDLETLWIEGTRQGPPAKEPPRPQSGDQGRVSPAERGKNACPESGLLQERIEHKVDMHAFCV